MNKRLRYNELLKCVEEMEEQNMLCIEYLFLLPLNQSNMASKTLSNLPWVCSSPTENN
jgi:hypothetical protein